ncbi:hypothetical protein NM208_g12931 [Fusarium decemcellulare]|uniref:Uncharacterized protein n=1 Tax=Fusarium decemcellulare TaxID=57161 RepID=A0ACC1RLQ3_9HYPO|nr:hypothetical protein NM208_g12931 [Fusarium decemcellulare]
MSIDPYLSAGCALSLAAVVRWSLDVSQRPGSNIRVLTMSSSVDNPFLVQLIQAQAPENHTVAHVDPGPFQDPAENAITSLADGDEIYDRIRETIESTPPKDTHAVLCFPPYEPAEALARAISGSTVSYELQNWRPFLPAPGDGDDIRSYFVYNETSNHRCCIFKLSPDFPIPGYLEGYTHVHIVPSRDRTVQAFDPAVRQFVSQTYPLSITECNALLWWCYQAYVPAVNTCVYPGSGGVEEYRDAERYHHRLVESTQSGGFIAGAYALADWGIDPSDVIECFDHNLAYFLSLDTTYPHIRSVKMQLAAAMIASVNFGPRVQFVDLKWFCAACCGLGEHSAPTGALWLKLALWKQLSNSNEPSWDLSDDKVLACGGCIETSSNGLREFNARVIMLVTAFTNIFGTPEERYDLNYSLTSLTSEIQYHLLQSYQNQLLVTRQDTNSQSAGFQHKIVLTGIKVTEVS